MAVADDAATVAILDRSDAPVAVPVERFDRLPQVTLPVPGVTSAAGRLWAAIRARGSGAFRARWSDAAVDSAAVDAATISLGTRRSAAIDLVTLGLAPRPELGLSRFETAWYQARGEAFDPKGDPATLIRLLQELPPGGYPDRVRLLMPWVTELCADPRLRGSAAELIAPFAVKGAAAARDTNGAAAGRDAKGVGAAVRDAKGAAAEGVDAAEADGATTGRGAANSNGAEAGEGAATQDAQSTDAATNGADARALMAALTPSPDEDIGETLSAYARTAATGAEAAVVERILAGGPLPDGAYGPALRELHRHATALARCRTDPGAATDEDLATVGFVAEQARRAYLAGKTVSGAHEAARHYRALLSYRSGRPVDRADLRPAARAVIEQLDQPVAGAAVAADPSAWPALWRAAAEGTVTVGDDLRVRYPGFGHWLDLGAVHRSLRDGAWAGAAAAADAIAAASDVLPLRAEALTLAAYGLWQLGRADEALTRLDEALAVHPVEGIAVNAALIADGPAVLPYLARVMGLTTSPDVRAGALTRAIDLWTAGMCGSGYPPALAAMVRGGLAVPQTDDDLHRTLLTLSFRNDRTWLASATVSSTGPLQERTSRYVQRRAAYETRPSKVTLRAVTVALIGVWRLHPRPAWVPAELSWLMDVFDRLIEAPFDSSTNPVPAVETLLGTEVLELAPSLILSVKAGAHLALAASRRGRSLPAETERRLILEPVRTYRMRRSELDEQGRKAVSAALAAALEAATGAIVDVTVTRNKQLVRRFRQLEMEPVQDYADGRRVVAQRIYVLDRFDGHVRRCRAYLKAMDGLPVNEGFVRQVRDAIDGWTGTSSRVRRSLGAV